MKEKISGNFQSCHFFTLLARNKNTGHIKQFFGCKDVLYGCETWSLTLWEERKLRLFENMV